jgi:hypothetical protein
MKTKHYSRKLRLNKKTIVDLSHREMGHFLGGRNEDPQPASNIFWATCPGVTCKTWCVTEGGTPDSDPCCQPC